MTSLFQLAHDALRRASAVVVVSHRKPDGDTLGAAAGVLRYCRSIGVRATGFCIDPVPAQYHFMPGAAAFTTDYAVFADPSVDTIAVFDAGDMAFAGIDHAVAGMRQRPTVLNFDHHLTNARFGDINVVDTRASSTTEVIYRFLEDAGHRIDAGTASCLLTGLLTDTGNLSNPATTVGSFSTAAALLRAGGKLREVGARLERNKPVPSLRVWGAALERMKYHPQLGIASTAIFQRDLAGAGVSDEQVEGVANFLNANLDARVVLVLKEHADGRVKASLRTAQDIDVAEAARLLGGGGHKKASGFVTRGRIIEQATHWQVERF